MTTNTDHVERTTQDVNDGTTTTTGDYNAHAAGRSSRNKRRLTKQERKKMKRMMKNHSIEEKTVIEQISEKQGKGVETSPDAAAEHETKRKKKIKKKKNKKENKKASDHQLEECQAEGDAYQQEQKQQEEDDDESLIFQRSLNSYEPIEIPTKPSANILDDDNNRNTKSNNQRSQQGEQDHEGGGRSLGKWFPSAILVKCQVHYTNTGQKIVHSRNNKSNSSNYIVSRPPKDASSSSSTPQPTAAPKASLALFYQYTDPKGQKWSKNQLQLLMTYLQSIATKRNIGGRIRVAPEGVNATLSAVDDIKTEDDGDDVHGRIKTTTVTAQETLRHVAEDLKRFDTIFEQTDFKFIDHLSPDRHFKELKILPVQELVFYDIQSNEAPLVMEDKDITETVERSNNGTSSSSSSSAAASGRNTSVKHLDAKEYHEMLQKDNTVVIDVRNHYEAILGRFDGQMKNKKSNGQNGPADATTNESTTGGAEYIDPRMRKSTDFKEWLSKDETRQKIKGKTVMMFCTGGIRCERASVYLKGQMGEEVGNVYQLQGGIERYLKAFPDGGMWTGKNFTFDKREAVGVDCPDGDGGVIRRKDKKSISKKVGSDKDMDNSGTYVAKCCICDKPWDRYVGKKKCVTCGVPVLVCDSCLSQKPDKTPGMELKRRCPLCVEENITVLASQVEFTDNGIHGKHTMTGEGEYPGDGVDNSAKGSKAAKSVLKWGGGHAQEKKQRKKFKRTICRFGSECVRKDCFFYHPDNHGATDRSSGAGNPPQKHVNNKKSK